MARTEIPVYQVNRVDYNPYLTTTGDPDNGMYFTDNSGYSWLEIENTGSTAIIVGAVVNGNAVDDITIPDKQISVDGGSTTKFGPFPKPYYSQSDLTVYFDIDPDGLGANPDAGTALKFSAFKVA